MSRPGRRVFVGCSELGGRECIAVDGAPAPNTVLTLSHWPGTPTPPELAADTSAEIGFRFLDDARPWPDAGVVTNDHFDEDGLVALFVLIDPEQALRRRELLCDVARAGDFKTFRDRRAARISFAIAALADPGRSPLPAAALRWAERTPGLYRELLSRLVDLVDHTERHRELWGDEDDFYRLSASRLDRGRIAVDEVPELDLAVVTVLDGPGPPSPAAGAGALFHPAAVHNRTDASLLAVVAGRRYELRYRYESWVRMSSRRPRPRADLSALADLLSEGEPEDRRWVFDGVGATTPAMRLVVAGGAGGIGSAGRGRPRAGPWPESAISPERFLAAVTAYLGTARPAWDPYAGRAPGAP